MSNEVMLAEIRENVEKIVIMLTTHTVEIKQIKIDIKPIDSLVAWRNRWGGALIALSSVATFVGVIVGLKVFL